MTLLQPSLSASIMASEFPQHWSNTAPAQSPTMHGNCEVAADPISDFNGKIAVITGGATGIGLAIAVQLAKENATVVIASTNKGRLDEAHEEIKTAGSNCLPVVCDVSNRESVKELHEVVTDKFGHCDLLFCNAGVTTAGPYLNHRPEDWDWVYGVVLGGVSNCIQSFYPDMCRRKTGQIILTGSQAGAVPDWFTLHGPYTAAKAAVHALGTALRPEAAEHNVGVTVVIVAGTLTDIMKSERSRPEKFGDSLAVSGMKKREARRIPPEEVAARTLRGVKENAPFVATHPELKSLTKNYFDRILAAYDT